jgi:hypothetical protein
MINGIRGKPYIDLSALVNHKSFLDLHPAICRGFATANQEAAVGNLEVPEGFMNLEIYNNSFNPLYKLYNQYQELSISHPIRIAGNGLSDVELATYLKFAMGGYDLYTYHFLYDFKEGWRNMPPKYCMLSVAEYFPEVVIWIENLIKIGIFSHIGRAAFFMQEAGGISFEHKDPSVDPEFPEILSEFIHIQPSLKRPFYVRDKETMEKFYINTCISYWNDQDWHGGESIMEPSYAFRVDGIFTPEFRQRILNGK